jgi:ATP-binding cassette subfamily C protein CydC
MNNTLQRLLSLAMPLKGWIILASALGCLTIVSGIGLMATSAYLISAAAMHPSIAALSLAIVGVRFFGIARGVFRYLERYLSHAVSFQLLARIRVWFYQALEPLAPARLMTLRRGETTAYSSGDVLSRMVSDIETLQHLYVRLMAPPLVAALVGLLMWWLLGAFAMQLVLIFLFFYLMAGVGVPFLTHILSQRTAKLIVQIRSELNCMLVDGIQGLADLVAFGREAAYAERIRKLNRQLVHEQTRMAWLGGMQNGLGKLLTNLALWTMLIVAIPLVHTGHLNGIYLASLALATAASFEAVLPLSSAVQQLGSSQEAGRRLFEIVDAPPSVRDTLAVSPNPQGYDLVVHHLCFRYAPDAPLVLENISFTLPQGQCLALVGPSGAGKSTVVNLLLRFWDYEQGSILLGGHELRDYRQQDLSQLVSVVSQDTHLFNTTIRENLLLAKPEASQQELEQATQHACIHDFILSLPQGYETRVGEQGLCMSAGERQRLALARAFLKDAPLLILDEATANLDALTEQDILRAIHALRQGRTTLIITHRLTGLAMVDEIIVLEQGRVKERGTHQDLLQAESLYWKLCQSQHQFLIAHASSSL